MNPNAQIEGVEISKELCEIAKQQTLGRKNIKIVNSDILGYNPEKFFDCVVAEGVLGIFEDPLAQLDRWIGWLNPGGLLVVFGALCPKQINFKFYLQSLKNNHGWESGFNCPSVESIEKHFNGTNKLDCFIFPFEINFSLPEDLNDPVRTYTVNIEGKPKCVLADSLIVNMYHIVLQEKS